MSDDFRLEKYLSDGIEDIIKSMIKISVNNTKTRIFMAKFSLACKKASLMRKAADNDQEHIPPFLIASITGSCNLNCAGCYARQFHNSDKQSEFELTDKQWINIFKQASKAGICFILLAGGEPLVRRTLIRSAGKIKKILFPVFTNGTLIDKYYIVLFNRYPNLIPILSIEGEKETTNSRRGAGIYETLIYVMNNLKENNIIFGVSVTVTSRNIIEVTSDPFLDDVCSKGCKIIFYVEYIPVDEHSKSLQLDNIHRKYLQDIIMGISNCYEEILIISFPGDELLSGGYLAAGRGFIHINSRGDTEPCPFSPYSDTNLKTASLKSSFNSPLFKKIRQNDILTQEHSGGCVLFDKEKTVALLAAKEE